MRKTKLIDIKRLFIYPLLVTTLLTVLFGFLIYQIAARQYKEDFANRGLNLASSYSMLVTRNYEFEQQIVHDLDQRLISAGHTVISERDELSDEKLVEIAANTNVDYIWWFTPTGEVLFDSSSVFNGWQSQAGDPIDQFIKSDLDIFIEGIRKSTDTDEYYYVVYVRASDDYFVEVAYVANYVLEELENVSPSKVTSNIFNNNENVLYASVIGRDFEVIADTRENATATPHDDSANINRALLGETFSADVYGQSENDHILNIYTPVYHNNEIVSVLVIGYSLTFYYNFIQSIALVTLIIILIIVGAYTVSIFLSVVRPIRNLDSSVVSFNVETGDYEKPKQGYKVFRKLFSSLDILSKKIRTSNHENYALTNEIQKLAFTDYLTEIPNRISLEKVIAIKSKQNKKFALMFIDIDDFKTYNDTKGHVFGDNLLIRAASVFKSLQRKERFLVYRYGGDEFVIIKDFEKNEEIDGLVNTIEAAFNVPLLIEEDEYSLDISIGISLFPIHGKDANELVRKADIAMYNAKNQSTLSYVFYQEQMDEDLQEEIKLTQEIKRALRSDGFKIVIQPQYDIALNEVVSYEALARFRNLDVSPLKFIKIAEKSNLINDLGRVIIKETIDLLVRIRDHGSKMHTIYVNFSAKQLSDNSLTKYIEDLLLTSGVPAEYFGVEITESTLIDNEDSARQILGRLQGMGIKIAIDDFGSGQAGLNYLTKYPVEMVKLDREFCQNYLKEGRVQVFNALVNFAQMLGFQVLAEGIENQEQIDSLKQTKCGLVQGYYYSRPFEIEKLFED